MTLLLFGVIALLVMSGIYFAVVRGGLGLLSKRLDEDPELSKPVPDDKRDGLPTDIEY